MGILFFLELFSLITLALAGNNVLELTDNDFAEKTAAYETVLVMFYAPW